jgi:hypothetical protein
MRSAAVAGLVVVLFAPHVIAQQTPYRATVSDPDVVIRAAPSDRLDDTGTLSRGAVVIVEREEANGWLAITAPYGSVSWIATQFINDPAPEKPVPKNVLVEADDEVTLAAGKAGLAQPLDIRRVKIPTGTAVLIIGPKVTFSGKTWYPIVPPAGDLRYIPKTAVQFEKVATSNFTVNVNENPGPVPPPAPVAPSAGAPVGAAPVPVAPAAPVGAPIAGVPAPADAAKPIVNHPLWIQAETAERENRLADAEKAYFDLAAIMNGPGGDHDIANLCYTRIHAIRERKRASNTGGQPVNDDRGVRPGPPQAITTSATGVGAAAVIPKPNGAAPTGTPGGERPDWIGPGTLRLSVLTLDGIDKKTYSLESAPGAPIVYVLAAPGADLGPFLNKRINVLGVPQERKGLKHKVVVALDVAPAAE